MLALLLLLLLFALIDEELEAELEEDGDGDSEIDLRVLRESKILLLVSSVLALESLEYLTKFVPLNKSLLAHVDVVVVVVFKG